MAQPHNYYLYSDQGDRLLFFDNPSDAKKMASILCAEKGMRPKRIKNMLTSYLVFFDDYIKRYEIQGFELAVVADLVGFALGRAMRRVLKIPEQGNKKGQPQDNHDHRR